jgi:preprotein translocase subunit SecD
MRRKELVPLVSILVVTVAALVYTLAAGNQPLLGLDLQGGVSVVLQPADQATDEELEQSIGIMRRRVDALGVAEPEVSRQGDTILVALPGVDDPQRALDLIGQTAELRFRPVLETELGPEVELTLPEEDEAEVEVVLEGENFLGEIVRHRMGPTALTGSGIVTADALYDQLRAQWYVLVEFQSGPEGLEPFNELAQICFSRQPACPTGQLGIVLDGTVISTPEFQTASFEDSVQITGNFTQESARDLALVLRFGALPVQLEPQQTQTVSATIGRDALDAGIVAGIVGVLIVALYMIAYYRLLGVVAMVSLGVSFALIWSIVSWLGATQGLALTLAGVTGLIVSIGVSVDSNIVYFENVKEDVREGRPVRSSVERSFITAFQHHRQGRRHHTDRCRPSLLVDDRTGARVRVLPRPGYDHRPDRVVLPDATAGHRPRPGAATRRPSRRGSASPAPPTAEGAAPAVRETVVAGGGA